MDIEKLITDAGGTVDKDSVMVLPDGSGCLTASFPLPEDHWSHGNGKSMSDPPPMTFRMGTDDPRREAWAERIRDAVKHGYLAATMNGTDHDLDPDALVQNIVVAMLGYWTPDGGCSNPEDASWSDPPDGGIPAPKA